MRKRVKPCQDCGNPIPKKSIRCRQCYHIVLTNRKGTTNPAWRGGRVSPSAAIRASKEYVTWRKAVFARDNYTCQGCGKQRTTLHAHHIKSFASYPELRFVIDNGVTLCKRCHNLAEGKAVPDRPRVIHDQCPACGEKKLITSVACRRCRPGTTKITRICQKCPNPVSQKGVRLCWTCRLAERRKPKPQCLGCGKELSDCRSTRCRQCANTALNQNRHTPFPDTKRQIGSLDRRGPRIPQHS